MFNKIYTNIFIKNHIKIFFLLIIPIIYKISFFLSSKKLTLLLENLNNTSVVLTLCITILILRWSDDIIHYIKMRILINYTISINTICKRFGLEYFLDNSYYHLLNDRDAYTSLSNLMHSLRWFMLQCFNTIYPSVVSIFMLIIFCKNLKIAMILFTYTCILLFCAYKIFHKIIKPQGNIVNTTQINLNRFYNDMNNNLLTTKTFHMKNFLLKHHEQKLNEENISVYNHHNSILLVTNGFAMFSTFMILVCMLIISYSDNTLIFKKQILMFMFPIMQEFYGLSINMVWLLDLWGYCNYNLSILYKPYHSQKTLLLTSLLSSIKINNIDFKYDNKYIFKNFSCEFDKGIYHLKGISGRGKSTLIKIIMGLLPVEAGDIYINEVNINGSSVTKKFSYATQNSLVFDTSVEENILLDKEKNHQFGEIIEKLNLKNILSRNAGILGQNLSGGELKRVVIARMLFHHQEGNVVIFDEPFEGLNEELIKEILNFILLFQDHIVIVIDHTNNISKLNNINTIEI